MLDRRFLDVSLVVSGVANQPASNPTAGTQYIVGSAPIGAFANVTVGSIARYNGTAWKFFPATAGSLEAFNAETGEVLSWNGSAWVKVFEHKSEIIAPVIDIVKTGTTLPSTATTGDKFLKTDDGKLYTATATDTWNAGTALSEGDRYASSTDFKVYEMGEEELTGTAIPSGSVFLNKADSYVYVRDTSAFVKASADIVDTDIHTLTAAEATAKSFTLTHSVASDKELDIVLSVCGVIQVAGVDYTASGNTISWNGKGLENIALAEGDVFVVHYVRA